MNTLVSETSHAVSALRDRLVFAGNTLRLRGVDVKMSKKQTKETLADFVRRILNEKNLTFKDVERLSGKEITAGSVNKIVNNGMENLTAKTIDALARGLGESPENIFYIIIGRSPNNTDSELAALFHNYGGLSEEDKREFDILLEVVKNDMERRRSKKV